MNTPELLAQLAEQLGKHQVVTEPYEHDGVVVIPVVHVRAGGGLGGRGRQGRQADDANGGMGIVARPVGAWIVKDGDAVWQPAIDVNRIVLGGQAIALAALVTVYWLIRRRRDIAD